MGTKSMFSLLLFLFQSLSTSSKFDLTKNLASYELIHKSQLSHNIVKRGATLSTHKYNQIREIDFKALGLQGSRSRLPPDPLPKEGTS